MSRAKFEELALKLDPAPDGYRATVILPTALSGRDMTFTLPDGLVADLSLLATHAVVRTGDPTNREVGPAVGRPDPMHALDPDRLGASLFDVLFRDSVRDAYNEVLRKRKVTNRPLRVRFQISRDAPELLRIPWELLRADSSRLALVGSVVRDLQTDVAITTPRPPSEINVLVVVADPPRLRALDIESERRGIEEAFRTIGDGRVSLDVVDGSWDGLVEHLGRAQQTSHPYHVFHFIGHGDTDATDESYLCFERDGDVDPITGSRLAELLMSRAPTIRLAFINACHSSSVSTTDAFGGLAQALVGAHIPVTIAMQFAVSDRAAIELSSRLYRLVAGAMPIEEALLEARRSLEARFPVEWATPTIFMANASVELFRARSFEPTTQSPPAPPPPVSTVITRNSPWVALERVRGELAAARRWIVIAGLTADGSIADGCTALAAESLRGAMLAGEEAKRSVSAMELRSGSRRSLAEGLQPIMQRYLSEVCEATPPTPTIADVDVRSHRLQDTVELLQSIAGEPIGLNRQRAAWEQVMCWRIIHGVATVLQQAPDRFDELGWLLRSLVESAAEIPIASSPTDRSDTIADIDRALTSVHRSLALGHLDRVVDGAARIVEEALHLADPAAEILADVA